MIRSTLAPLPVAAVGGGRIRRLSRRLRDADRRFLSRPGWPRVLRNMLVGFVIQAGSRMAAALSYYALFAAGPTLVLTMALGRLLFGEEATREIVVAALPRLLPPSADVASQFAQSVVRTSASATGLAIVAGLFALTGFTRALATSLNAMLNEIGSEPIHRTVALVPLLYLAVLGLLWGSWVLGLLGRYAWAISTEDLRPSTELFIGGVAPLVLALLHVSVILTIVPRARLAPTEILVSACFGAILWEAARHLFGWLIGTDSFYLRLFGSLGGVVALLGWIYVSNAILILTGQFAWAFAMERRGRGDLARRAPRRAGLAASVDPFDQDNAVNEAQI